MAVFPIKRLRRLRETEKIREIMQEITVVPKDLIHPIFVQDNLKSNDEESMISMPDIKRLSIPNAIKEIDEIRNIHIPAIMLFGIPSYKDEIGTSAFDQNGIIQKTIKEIKKYHDNKIVIVSDVCLCQYTNSGHCGIINNNKIDNDISIKTLTKIAISQAESGTDIVSPSAMMDGQVSAIRQGLDDAGFSHVGIMSHSAKHSSSFYSPFRDIAKCAPKFGDRKSYQVSFTNPNESMREVEADINEGTDIIMIKPALSYLDLIHKAKEVFNMPLAAYSVSGEYALVKGAAKQGWIIEKEIVNEILHSIKRAGADMIITYFAKYFAKNFYNL
ncbi:MAG: porphobilinogen synthase [Thaumarchaeota archaeon]|nr:porphobilinogen synthase [Nitrososphaerota archaeon]MCY3976260.1 porphobilinogen synthase [Nitrososphaerota archaeon]